MRPCSSSGPHCCSLKPLLGSTPRQHCTGTRWLASPLRQPQGKVATWAGGRGRSSSSCRQTTRCYEVCFSLPPVSAGRIFALARCAFCQCLSATSGSVWGCLQVFWRCLSPCPRGRCLRSSPGAAQQGSLLDSPVTTGPSRSRHGRQAVRPLPGRRAPLLQRLFWRRTSRHRMAFACRSRCLFWGCAETDILFPRSTDTLKEPKEVQVLRKRDFESELLDRLLNGANMPPLPPQPAPPGARRVLPGPRGGCVLPANTLCCNSTSVLSIIEFHRTCCWAGQRTGRWHSLELPLLFCQSVACTVLVRLAPSSS